MSFKLDTRSIALNGIGFGTKAVALMGFRWFSIDVIPPQPPVIDEFGGGFGGSKAKLIITVKVKGKWKRNEYEISDHFYKILSISASIKNKINIVIGIIQSSFVEIKQRVKLNSIDTIKPEISVKEKTPNFKIRRKK